MRDAADHDHVRQLGVRLVLGDLRSRGFEPVIEEGRSPVIVVHRAGGRVGTVHVKSAKRGSWQFTITRFCEIRFEGERQVVGPLRPLPSEAGICALVELDSDGNRIFVLRWKELRDIVVDDYRSYLARFGGRRPRKWDSLHCAIGPGHLPPGSEGAWSAAFAPIG